MSQGTNLQSKGIVFESLKEHRGKYFVEYTPAWAGQYFAGLSLAFVEDFDIIEVPKLMELECSKWIERYPIPIFVSAFDSNDDPIDLDALTGSIYLIGIPSGPNSLFYWELIGGDAFPHGPYQEIELLEIYKNRPFSTDEERCIKADTKLRQRYWGSLIFSLIWLGVALFVDLTDVIDELLGDIVKAYAVLKAMWNFMKMRGKIKESEQEKQKAEERRQMEHHHYHCKLNPEGFIRLRTENLTKSIRDDLHEESQELLRQQTDLEQEP